MVICVVSIVMVCVVTRGITIAVKVTNTAQTTG